MKFKLESGALEVTEIKGADFMRLTSIELAILEKIGYLEVNPVVDDATTFHFDPRRTEDVRTVLIGFMVEA